MTTSQTYPVMLSNEEIDRLVIAALPHDKGAVLQLGYDKLQVYMSEHGLTWRGVYQFADATFNHQRPYATEAANDEELNFELSVFKKFFGGDADLAYTLYWLAPLHMAGKNMAASLMANQWVQLADKTQGESEKNIISQSSIERRRHHKRLLADIVDALEAMNMPQWQAKVCVGSLERSINAQMQQKSP